MRKLFCGIVMALAVLLQSTILSRLSLWGLSPEILLGLIVAFSLIMGPVSGALMGAIIGGVLDVLFAYTQYLAFVFMLSGMIAGFIGEWITPRAAIAFVLAAALTLFKETLAIGLLFFQQVQIGAGAVWLRILGACAFEGVVAFVAYWLVSKIDRTAIMDVKFFIRKHKAGSSR